MIRVSIHVSLASVGALAIAEVAAAGAVLWDQAPNPDGPAYVDQQFGNFPTFSVYQVHDVSFLTDVTVTSVITYFTLSDPTGWPAGEAIDAVLNIFPKTGSLPMGSDDPTAGTAVIATLMVGAVGFELVADSLSIDLAAGDYWIGLTPGLDFGAFGQEFHQAALVPMGDNSAARNPGEGFALGPDWFEAGPTFGDPPVDPWDGAITIEGIPTPGALALIGMAGLFGSRRRRHG